MLAGKNVRFPTLLGISLRSANDFTIAGQRIELTAPVLVADA